jgi:hypothetical protein
MLFDGCQFGTARSFHSALHTRHALLQYVQRAWQFQPSPNMPERRGATRPQTPGAAADAALSLAGSMPCVSSIKQVSRNQRWFASRGGRLTICRRLTICATTSPAMTTLESTISPTRAESTVDGCGQSPRCRRRSRGRDAALRRAPLHVPLQGRCIRRFCAARARRIESQRAAGHRVRRRSPLRSEPVPESRGISLARSASLMCSTSGPIVSVIAFTRPLIKPSRYADRGRQRVPRAIGFAASPRHWQDREDDRAPRGLSSCAAPSLLC